MKNIFAIVLLIMALTACTNGTGSGKKVSDTTPVRKDTGYRYDSSTQPHGPDKQ